MDVWAIDPKLNQLTKKDVVLSESNVVTQLPLRIHLLGGQSFPPSKKPHIHTSNLAASTKLAHVEYLQLKHSDIPRLLALHQLRLDKFDAVFVYDNETCKYSLCKSVPVSRYSFSIDETDSRANLESALIGKIKFSDRELDYVLCNQYSGEEQYNHPVDIVETCSVTQSECWVLEEHLSTAFVELSKAAFELLEMGEKAHTYSASISVSIQSMSRMVERGLLTLLRARAEVKPSTSSRIFLSDIGLICR
ncbi:hypothetical protein [Vibrio sp. MMH1-50]|uniref:hypothetical protein n=1 Tax=Vibrio sp. MMH1-50 TaxID=2917764 RepID=UPI001EF1F496|nr:hypothetical protein [Vibrio sp. MMH1-50]MCG7513547.1 hypothetical protein [Vibrio sp. MMH1-50]